MTRYHTGCWIARAFHSAPQSQRYVNPVIYALSTPQGKGGVSVFRVSGPAALEVYRALCPQQKAPTARVAALRTIQSPRTAKIIDQGLVLWFKAPHSFTGEDVLEFQVHGGVAVAKAMLQGFADAAETLKHVHAVRPAEPGEFSYRALENGKIGLTQAEGLADMINAQTEYQRAAAVSQAGGGVQAVYDDWRQQLIQCRSLVEAIIDFEDEGQADNSMVAHVKERVTRLLAQLQTHLQSSIRGEILQQGIRVVIVGPPNAGKSSLLNLLAQRSASIVSDMPGTTRDVVQVSLDVDGLPAVISDTAGIRAGSSLDPVEREGIRRARLSVQEAHVVIFLLPHDYVDADGMLRDTVALLSPEQRKLLVINKIDRSPLPERDAAIARVVGGGGLHAYDAVQALSCTTRENWDGFVRNFSAQLRAAVGIADASAAEHGILSTNSRHRHHTLACIGYLERFAADADSDIVLAAEDLRSASNELGRVCGNVDVEDVLGQIFSDFCIGK